MRGRESPSPVSRVGCVSDGSRHVMPRPRSMRAERVDRIRPQARPRDDRPGRFLTALRYEQSLVNARPTRSRRGAHWAIGRLRPVLAAFRHGCSVVTAKCSASWPGVLSHSVPAPALVAQPDGPTVLNAFVSRQWRRGRRRARRRPIGWTSRRRRVLQREHLPVRSDVRSIGDGAGSTPCDGRHPHRSEASAERAAAARASCPHAHARPRKLERRGPAARAAA